MGGGKQGGETGREENVAKIITELTEIGKLSCGMSALSRGQCQSPSVSSQPFQNQHDLCSLPSVQKLLQCTTFWVLNTWINHLGIIP